MAERKSTRYMPGRILLTGWPVRPWELVPYMYFSTKRLRHELWKQSVVRRGSGQRRPRTH